MQERRKNIFVDPLPGIGLQVMKGKGTDYTL